MTPNTTVQATQNPYRLLIFVARLTLWLVIVTASLKAAEIFGPGEQFWGTPPASDVAVRALILLACMFATGVAIITDRVTLASLSFVPFLLWAFAVAVVRQSDLASAKQLGSYASWIFFYIAAVALLDRPGDYRKLVSALIVAVVLSTLGGALQHYLGYGPALGSRWPEAEDAEFMRTHTGSGGILLDAFTPYCAAMLLLSLPGSLKRQALAWLLVLWGTANILRGGLLAFAIALGWYLVQASRTSRRQILASLSVAFVIGVLLFGGTIASKIGETDEGVNTSGRLDAWPILTQWITEEPFLGHGPDADMELLAESAAGRDLRASHNELLSTGVNFGVIGILLLWTPLIALLVRAIGQSLRASQSVQASVSAATGVLIMITVLSLTDNTLRTPGVMILALAPAAITGAGRKESAAPHWLRQLLSAAPRAEREAC